MRHFSGLLLELRPASTDELRIDWKQLDADLSICPGLADQKCKKIFKKFSLLP